MPGRVVSSVAVGSAVMVIVRVGSPEIVAVEERVVQDCVVEPVAMQTGLVSSTPIPDQRPSSQSSPTQGFHAWISLIEIPALSAIPSQNCTGKCCQLLAVGRSRWNKLTALVRPRQFRETSAELAGSRNWLFNIQAGIGNGYIVTYLVSGKVCRLAPVALSVKVYGALTLVRGAVQRTISQSLLQMTFVE